MKDYSEHLEELNLKFRIADGYDFSDDEIALEYQKLYEFCQVNLERVKNEFLQIDKPSYIYIKDCDELNARAYNNSFVICVFKGLFQDLYNFFIKDGKLKSLNDYRLIEGLSDSGLEYLLFQQTLLFIYYHELAHIIQYNNYNRLNDKFLEYSRGERYQKVHEDYNRLSHIMEVDADTHAVNLVCTHIANLLEENKEVLNEELKTEIAIKLAKLSLVGIIIYWFKLNDLGNSKNLRSGDHPNILVRVTIVISILLSKLQTDLGITEKELSNHDLLHDSFDLITELAREKGIVSSWVGDYIIFLKDYKEEISKYSDEILAEMPEHNFLLRNTIHKST